MNRFELISLVSLISEAIIKAATAYCGRQPFFNTPFGVKGSPVMHAISALAYSKRDRDYGMGNWIGSLPFIYEEKAIKQWWHNAATIAVLSVMADVDENNPATAEEYEKATDFIVENCVVEFPECYYHFSRYRKDAAEYASFPKSKAEAQAWTDKYVNKPTNANNNINDNINNNVEAENDDF